MLRLVLFILFCTIVCYCINYLVNETNKGHFNDYKNSSTKYACNDRVIDNHTQKIYKILGLLDNYEIEPMYILRRYNGVLISKLQSDVENEFLYSKYNSISIKT